MTLTLDEVRKTKFHMARRNGYEVSEVDLFVDRVEASFAQLAEENQMLKQQMDALKQAQKNEDRREPSAEELRREQQRKEQQRQEQERQEQQKRHQQAPVAAAPGRGEKLVVTTSAEASPAVIRLVQMATEQSEQLVNEADAEAKRKVEEANQRAKQITTDARTKADRVESEARVNAEKMTAESQARSAEVDRQVAARRTELFAKLESERDQLKTSVAQLRSFEASYRQNLTSHLRNQIQSIERGVFEPNEKPGLIEDRKNDGVRNERRDRDDTGPRQQSSTPRLDALLGDNNR